MRKDSLLAGKETPSLSDLKNLPLIVSRAAEELFFNGTEVTRLNIAAIYNLIFNASLPVEDGVGYALGFDKLIKKSDDNGLCFRPLVSAISAQGTLV